MKTRAALFHAVGEPLEVVELDLDEPASDEVVVRMAAVGICGTDLHQVKGEFQRPTPMVLGHEGAGVVEEVGDAVDVAPGGRRGRPLLGAVVRRVRRLPPRPAGRVHAAQRARSPTARCADGTTGMSHRGETVYRGTATGCLAERVVVTEQVALPLRGAVPLEQAALLGCAALTGVGAVLFAAHVTPGASVLVIGAGGVGQFVVQGARIAGAGAIVACDPSAARRDAGAHRSGATHVAVPDDLRELLRSELPDGADFAFDAVGYPETTETALRSTRDGGTTVIVGLPPQGLRLDLDPFELIREGEAAHRHDLRLGGSGRRAPRAARARPRRVGSSSRARSARRSRSTGSTTRSTPASRARPAGSSSCPSRLAQKRVALRGNEAVRRRSRRLQGCAPPKAGIERRGSARRIPASRN